MFMVSEATTFTVPYTADVAVPRCATYTSAAGRETHKPVQDRGRCRKMNAARMTIFSF